MPDVKVTGLQLTLTGNFTDSGFDTTLNELRFSYHAHSDARFGKSNAFSLPKKNDGEVIQEALSLSAEQISQVKSAITSALSDLGFDPEYGAEE